MHIEELDWQDTLTIRQKVLWPNKSEKFCHVEGDNEACHYGVFIDKNLVCVASVYLHPIINNKGDFTKSARLRKFATLPSHQKQGIGSFVLTHIIHSLKTQSINTFWCDARESAIPFYQRFGLKTEGPRFYKSDIAYFKMQIALD